MPDLLQILINIQAVIPAFMSVLKTIVGIMSLFIVAGSMFELYGAANENSQKYLTANRRFSLTGGIVGLLVGGVMLSMVTLDFIDITTRTLTGSHVTSEILAYKSGGTSSLSANAKAGANTIFMLMQIVGFIAYMKFFLIMKARYDGSGAGQRVGGIGSAMTFLVAGFLCWNAQWAAEVLNDDIFGFKLLGLFFSN